MPIHIFQNVFLGHSIMANFLGRGMYHYMSQLRSITLSPLGTFYLGLVCDILIANRIGSASWREGLFPLTISSSFPGIKCRSEPWKWSSPFESWGNKYSTKGNGRELVERTWIPGSYSVWARCPTQDVSLCETVQPAHYSPVTGLTGIWRCSCPCSIQILTK